ncbi:MAG TPA: hypothetical protein VFQ35_14105 [Polyangiaceae bacterium]|nr:hypothetical protein [Polyangiaceae bacterium]
MSSSFPTRALPALLVIACASQPPPPKVAPGPAPQPSSNGRVTAASQSLVDGGWGERLLRRLALGVQLPDAAHWREVGGSRWVRLEHPTSRSLLELSTSRERRLVSPEECEQRARLERPELPRPAEGEALDRRRAKLPDETFTNVTVSLEEAGGEELVGHLTFFGASVGRCLVGHFSTRVSGAERDQEVARRLRLAVDGILPTLRRMAADERVQPQPFER